MHTLGAFRGLQLVPPILVNGVRQVLMAQGIPPDAISDSGELDAVALVTMGFDTLEIRTAVPGAEQMIINLKGPADPDTAAFLQAVQPAVILTGPGGKAQIAPYGLPSGVTPAAKRAVISIGLGLGAAVVGLILFGGALRRR